MVLNNGQVISNRYEIIEKIGSGGMSLVYRAKDTKLDRFVTFKVLRHEHITDDEFTERFKIEARAVARLSHPNIVNVYDVGNEGDINYIVMEYIDGLTLKELITKKAPFGNDEILGVAIQINDALMHAHANGIVHRDIKPQNILVTNKGAIKVTDFGIARTVNSNTISVGNNTLGSVHYISPEQARGGFIDAKSDLYSLGIVMYEMATGELPFDGESSVAVALMQINEPLPDMTEINPDISQDVENIIIKLTDKKPFNRYMSDQELSEALKSAMVRAGGSDDAALNAQNTSRLLLSSIFAKKPDAAKPKSKPLDADPYDEEDGEDVYDKIAERKVMVAAILTALFAIGLILFFLWSYFQPKNEQRVNIVMPNFEGEQFESAREKLAEYGFELVLGGERADETAEAGVILEQNYPEGHEFEQGQTLTGDEQITVIVSSGKEQAEVPDVTNKEFVDAAQTLVDNSFEYLEEYVYDDDTPKDFVIRQEPEGGAMADPGTQVTIYLSLGKEIKKVIVPTITGQSEDNAKIALQSRNLQIGNISYAPSNDYAAGTVARQLTTAGSEIQEGQAVGFVVSTGPAPTEEPVPEEEEPRSDDIEGVDDDGDGEIDEDDERRPPAEDDEPDVTDPFGEPGDDGGGIVSTRYISVPSRDFPEEMDSVTVQIMRRTDEGQWVIVTNMEVDPAELPIEVPVSGTGTQQFSVHINAVEVASGAVDFNE